MELVVPAVGVVVADRETSTRINTMIRIRTTAPTLPRMMRLRLPESAAVLAASAATLRRVGSTWVGSAGGAETGNAAVVEVGNTAVGLANTAVGLGNAVGGTAGATGSVLSSQANGSAGEPGAAGVSGEVGLASTGGRSPSGGVSGLAPNNRANASRSSFSSLISTTIVPAGPESFDETHALQQVPDELESACQR